MREGDVPRTSAMLSKPATGAVARQHCGNVDFQIQQIADRIRIFIAIHALHRRRSRVRMERRLAIESAFEPRGETVKCRAVRPRGVLGRHHARAQFAHDSLPGHDIFFEMSQILCVEFEVPGLAPLVMTGDAILIEDGLRLLLRQRGSRRRVLAGLPLAVTLSPMRTGADRDPSVGRIRFISPLNF